MNEFSHLKNKLLAERVEDQIYHYILDTPIEPGAKLPLVLVAFLVALIISFFA